MHEICQIPIALSLGRHRSQMTDGFSCPPPGSRFASRHRCIDSGVAFEDHAIHVHRLAGCPLR